MLDGFVDVVSGCDIVSPTISFFRGVRNGPAVQFLVPADSGWSANQVRRMLESKGVIVWGVDVAGEDIAFKTRVTQARYAAYWLQRHRLRYELPNGDDLSGRGGASGDEPGRAANGKSSKPSSTNKSGMVDGMLDRIDRLADRL
jgi:hypothetical protein